LGWGISCKEHVTVEIERKKREGMERGEKEADKPRGGRKRSKRGIVCLMERAKKG